jgi:CBS domain-containing protein
VDEWTAILRERVQTPTPDAVVDADVFLDMRALTSGLDVGFAVDELAAGSDSPRLLHGLAQAANAFPPQLHAFGRLPKGPIDLKRSGLAPIVLLARLYGLQARSAAVATDARLRDAASAGRLSDDLSGRLRQAYSALSSMRLRNQLQQIDNRQYVTDKVDPAALTDEQIEEVKAAFRAVKSAQAATSLAFRTDL